MRNKESIEIVLKLAIKILFIYVFAIGVFFTYIFIVFANSSLNVKVHEDKQEYDNYFVSPFQNVIEIKKGANAKKIGNILEKRNIIVSSKMFYILARLYNFDTKLQCGEYELTADLTPQQLLFNMSSGKVKQYSFTVVPGMNIQQLIFAINNDSNFDLDISTYAKLNSNLLLKELKIKEKHLEGIFLPDTYYYTKGTKAIELLKRIYRAQQDYLNLEWEKRNKTIPIKNKYEALILASIVEKETSDVAEMKKVAGVYLLRIKKNMRLQADPTVIYGIDPNLKRLLTKKDLQKKTPYNTYKNYGLTPTPIAMPSKNAIKAVLNPEFNDYLYFVANKKGAHVFSKNLIEHQNHINLIYKKK